MAKLNDRIAVILTMACGTMWMFYAFICLCLIPLVHPAWQSGILFVGNAIQLAFLPLLLVGQNLMGRSAEERELQDHNAIMEELREIKEMHAQVVVIHESIQELRCVAGGWGL